jgi:hypothetical protein
MKPAALVAICFLSLVALAHVARLALGTEVIVGSLVIPMWASVPAVIGPGAIAVWLWKEQGK